MSRFGVNTNERLSNAEANDLLTFPHYDRRISSSGTWFCRVLIDKARLKPEQVSVYVVPLIAANYAIANLSTVALWVSQDFEPLFGSWLECLSLDRDFVSTFRRMLLRLHTLMHQWSDTFFAGYVIALNSP